MPERPSVVFVPGFMQRGAAWSPVAELVGERYTSTCLDLRSSSLEERLAEIDAAAPPPAVLVGYSMGGRLALHAALARPRPLVLVGASAGIEDAAERAARRRADEDLAAWIEAHSIEEVVARWEALPVFASQPPELVDAQRPGRLSHDPRELAALLRSAGQGAMAPVWGRLPELRAPFLALAGAEDERYAAAARRMAALVPGGRCELVPGAGHALQLERPSELARLLLEFLDEHLGEC